MHAPSYDDRPFDPTRAPNGRPDGAGGPGVRYASSAPPLQPTGMPTGTPTTARSPLQGRLRDPKQRALLLGAAALLVLLIAVVAWYGSPTNRARRELAAANASIVDKQREVDDARRLLERRLAELRAVRAQADVQATVYRGVMEREQRPEEASPGTMPGTSSGTVTSTVGGEVLLPPVAPNAVGPNAVSPQRQQAVPMVPNARP